MIDFFGVKIGDTVADVYAIFAPAGRGSHTTVELYVDRRGGGTFAVLFAVAVEQKKEGCCGRKIRNQNTLVHLTL